MSSEYHYHHWGIPDIDCPGCIAERAIWPPYHYPAEEKFPFSVMALEDGRLQFINCFISEIEAAAHVKWLLEGIARTRQECQRLTPTFEFKPTPQICVYKYGEHLLHYIEKDEK